MNEYKLIEEFDITTLNSCVNELLKIGYKLYGDPIITTQVYDNETINIYAQALTKET